MATPLLQKARQRKMIYFGAIVVLFTLSLIHREFLVKPQALLLQLRETSRGEVELTSSAVRLMLTGSRGIAVTMLWYTAQDKQKRGEWQELELLVNSITKLQPYFITPWLYQSWNLSFNVAVECDQPRDKYHYISRGLALLAEGERRNRGTGDFPGNPEMRHFMGFYYQLKIGGSDERRTMRSLLEMSCIDPAERDPDLFLAQDALGYQAVNLKEFEKFCAKYPRLVRRLREQLDYTTPQRIVQFLHEYKDIPNRFKPIDPARKQNIKESELKDPLDQFPILPPREANWPDPTQRDMTSESIDVFLICRTWYEFAQKPLPPPDPNPRPEGQQYDKLRKRIPKNMMTQLFRQYPARAQVYIAEALETEGFFDSEGWQIDTAFEILKHRRNPPVGTDAKYHSRRAWETGFKMYKRFGEENGLLLEPSEIASLNQRAELFRAKTGVPADARAPVQPEWRQGELGKSLEAHQKLYYSNFFRNTANFDSFYDQAEGEQDPITASARKRLFFAERSRKQGVPTELMLRNYEQAFALYLHACLKHPKFSKVSNMQLDFYEIYQRYLGQRQEVYAEEFKNRAVSLAKLGFHGRFVDAGNLYDRKDLAPFLAGWPYPNWRDAVAALAVPRPRIDEDNALRFSADDSVLLAAKLASWPYPNWRATMARYALVTAKEKEQQEMIKVVPTKLRTGPLDRVQIYDGPAAMELRDFLFRWTQGAALSQNSSVAGSVTYPGHEYYLLTRSSLFMDEKSIPQPWRPLITEESRRIARNRLGLDR